MQSRFLLPLLFLSTTALPLLAKDKVTAPAPAPASTSAAPTPRPKPERFAKEIAAFTKAEPRQGGIVFTGSSSIRLWKSLEADFPDLPVLNRGFGGSVANDLIVYAEEAVLRNEPRLLVTYTGSNDLNAKLTVQEAFADYTRFLDLVHAKLPATRILITSVKISLKRETQIPQVKELNALLQSWAEGKDWVRFLDCHSYLADPSGKPIRAYFRDDLLHLSPEGYTEWKKVLDPVLREEWAKAQ